MSFTQSQAVFKRFWRKRQTRSWLFLFYSSGNGRITGIPSSSVINTGMPYLVRPPYAYIYLMSTEQIPIFAAAIKSAKSAQTGAKGYAGFYADSTLQPICERTVHPHSLSRSSSQLCQFAAGQRRPHEADPGMARSQRLFHHSQCLCAPGMQFQTALGSSYD